MTSSRVRRPPSPVTVASSTMFSISNSPQPRGVCSPASLAPRSGVSGTGRSVALIAAPVLHRVHRGLGHGRLEALEPGRGEAEAGDRPRDARDRLALVA